MWAYSDRDKEHSTATADNNEKRFNELKQKYASVLRMVEQTGVRLRNLHVENNQLFNTRRGAHRSK